MITDRALGAAVAVVPFGFITCAVLMMTRMRVAEAGACLIIGGLTAWFADWLRSDLDLTGTRE